MQVLSSNPTCYCGWFSWGSWSSKRPCPNCFHRGRAASWILKSSLSLKLYLPRGSSWCRRQLVASFTWITLLAQGLTRRSEAEFIICSATSRLLWNFFRVRSTRPSRSSAQGSECQIHPSLDAPLHFAEAYVVHCSYSPSTVFKHGFYKAQKRLLKVSNWTRRWRDFCWPNHWRKKVSCIKTTSLCYIGVFTQRVFCCHYLTDKALRFMMAKIAVQQNTGFQKRSQLISLLQHWYACRVS